MPQTSSSIRISIAMACWNGGRYLRDQLNSLLNQTRRPDEIVVCDDASTDETAAILLDYQKQYPDLFRIAVNESNLGCCRNFEKAIRLCTGDLIFLADQDDVWLPEKIATMSAASNLATRGVFCNSVVTDEALRACGGDHWRNRMGRRDAVRLAGASPAEMLALFLKRVPAAGHDMAFPAEWCRNGMLPLPELPGCHDTWIGLWGAALGAWSGVDLPLTLFRQHNANLSASGGRLSWGDRWRAARASVRGNSFAWNAGLFEALEARLASRVSAETLAKLEDRRQHSAARAAMGTGWRTRLPLIIGELCRRRYGRYGRGGMSVIQDLFMRG